MEIRRLNTLRGLAALIVLVSHYSNEANLFEKLLGAGAGQTGVMMFFLLSAFLITILYIRNVPSSNNIRDYVTARVARVAPLFLAVVLGSFIVNKLLPYRISQYAYNVSNLPTLTSHLLLATGDSVLWTVPPEVHFYLLFICFWLALSRFPRTVSWVLVGLVVIYFLIPQQTPSGSILGIPFQLNLLHTFPFFLTGVLLGLLYLKWEAPTSLKYRFIWLVLLALPLTYPQMRQRIFDLDPSRAVEPWTDWTVYATVVIVFFLLVFFLPEKSPILENNFGDFLGKVSYSAYLLHMPVLRILRDEFGISGLLGLLIFLACTFAISHISFEYFEKPSRNFLRGFAIEKRSVNE